MESLVGSLLSESIKGVPTGALLILTVIALVKYVLPKIEARLTKLEDASPTIQLALFKAEIERLREDHKELRSAYDKKAEVHDREFQAVWSKVGTRPGDRNQGGCDG